jgi:hypothetical protein
MELASPVKCLPKLQNGIQPSVIDGTAAVSLMIFANLQKLLRKLGKQQQSCADLHSRWVEPQKYHLLQIVP